MQSTLDLPIELPNSPTTPASDRQLDERNVLPQLPRGFAVSQPSRQRPLVRRVLQWIRRIHLYLGLFLFPWAVLYGFTGFLFNHPHVMGDQTVESFGHEVWMGTPMNTPSNVIESARQIVELLRAQQVESAADVKLIEAEPVRYVNDFANVTLKTPNEEISLSIAVEGQGGAIRHVPSKKATEPEADFPFAVGRAGQPRKGGRTMSGASEKRTDNSEKLIVQNSLVDRLQASIPNLVRTRSLPEGEVTVNSVPDLTFVVESQGKRWKTNYNALRGTVTGKPFEASSQPLSWRSYLTKMHKAHGYPIAANSVKWFWVLGADTLALVMIYWGGSGLLMWWQIKSTRPQGIAVLMVSALAATVLAIGMHGALSVG